MSATLAHAAIHVAIHAAISDPARSPILVRSAQLAAGSFVLCGGLA
ncbi:hypothetical protein [Thermoleptolyngbya sp. M55_K2018_002]|nr:hypothetical protein [Thermoleptolyngbya sp. M55_K2018_002]HIK39268.1 hypothetical protein [Thermoleptolyngbya sp. M55_K2018_002]